ncbi:cinnamyl-alcohol dehydrogenase flavonol reductase [Scheffersomyces xylosifermentans]|uniref:cinnamyl-alcohol dehydrogenase flavonol reductase n=1 Tax=Scheffersomyces xylosifermentans TaxID=1304137 RepID=UPI00315C5E26
MVKVFITGASGFIAQHIVKLLIDNGYDVVGTVRSTTKGEALKSYLNVGNRFHYEIVPDITSEGAFDEALKKNSGIKYLLHTASPFFYDTTDPEHDLIIPAINGTKNILNAVKKYRPEIEKVVITSSDAAIYNSEDEQNSSLSFDESSWNNISYEESLKDPIAAYYGAKSFAEKLAWKFLEEEKPNFKLISVNPVYVFGPQAFDGEVKEKLNTSNELIHTLIKLGPNDQFDNDKGGFIDVRDVAKAHLVALQRDDLIGRRLFMISGHFSTQMMVDILNSNFPELKGKIPVGNPGHGPQDIKTLAKVSNEKTRQLLGWEFNSLDTIVTDTIKQVLAVRGKL